MRDFSALAAHLIGMFAVFLVGGIGPGCASMIRDPVVEVRVARNADAPEREQKTYTITCKNALVQQWFLSNPRALLALQSALEDLGYEEALDPLLATHQIAAELGFGTRTTVQPVENEDSIRFKNVAGMAGQGRYSKILTERDETSGSLLMGPDGQLIATGAWKQMERDTEERRVEAPFGSHDALVLRAWDVSDGSATSARIFAWEVIVTRTNDNRTPSPEHVGILLRHAAERLAAGWSEESSGTPASSDATSNETVSSASEAPSS